MSRERESAKGILDELSMIQSPDITLRRSDESRLVIPGSLDGNPWMAYDKGFSIARLYNAKMERIYKVNAVQ